MNHADQVIVLRALLAAALGFIVGWQREHHGAVAGDRTFALVAMGSSMLTTLTFERVSSGIDKPIAGIITGVGFLGAGAILRSASGDVRGLTTAASMWVMASIGILVGAGEHVPGILLSGVVLALLTWDRLPILNRFARVAHGGIHRSEEQLSESDHMEQT